MRDITRVSGNANPKVKVSHFRTTGRPADFVPCGACANQEIWIQRDGQSFPEGGVSLVEQKLLRNKIDSK